MIQGSPLYGSPYLSFMDNSSLIRMDDTIERVEIVQGGTSAHFRPGAAGCDGELYFADRFRQDHRLTGFHLRI